MGRGLHKKQTIFSKVRDEMSEYTGPAIYDGSSDHTTFAEKSVYLRAVVGLTSALSIVGSLLIILSYVCFRDLRNKAREILVHISIMDLGVGTSNLVGVSVDFGRYFRCNDTTHHERHHRWSPAGAGHCPVPKPIEALCFAQGGVATGFTLGSIFWTICLSMYLYLLISQKGTKTAKNFLKFAYFFCYLMPVGLMLWLGFTHRIGYSYYESSGWCGAIFKEDDGNSDLYAVTFGYNLWILLTFILVPVLSISAHLYIKEEMRNVTHSTRFLSALQAVDFKFLLVPVAFILLRFWSFFGDIWFVYTHHRYLRPRILAKILMFLEGIGDSGQGVANGILFVLFTKKARERFICCWRDWRWWRRMKRQSGGEETRGLLETNRERINSESYMDNTYTPSFSPRTSPSHNN